MRASGPGESAKLLLDVVDVLAAGGPIDLVDAENAIAAEPKSLDVELVRKLALGFGTAASALLEGMLGNLGLGRQVSHEKGHGLDDALE